MYVPLIKSCLNIRTKHLKKKTKSGRQKKSLVTLATVEQLLLLFLLFLLFLIGDRLCVAAN